MRSTWAWEDTAGHPGGRQDRAGGPGTSSRAGWGPRGLTCCRFSFRMAQYWKWGSCVSQVASWALAQPVPTSFFNFLMRKQVSLQP